MCYLFGNTEDSHYVYRWFKIDFIFLEHEIGDPSADSSESGANTSPARNSGQKGIQPARVSWTKWDDNSTEIVRQTRIGQCVDS